MPKEDFCARILRQQKKQRGRHLDAQGWLRMNAPMLIMMLVLNSGIAWWNARTAGRSWLEARTLGGWVWILTWCTVIQAAAGFTSVFGILLAVAAGALHLLSRHGVHLAMGLSYLLVLFPILGSGLLITLSSWQIAFREKNISSLSVVAYNSLAMAYNTASAIEHVPSLWQSLRSMTANDKASKDSDDDSWTIIGIALTALAAGVCLTIWIVRTNMSKADLPIQAEASRSCAE
jgi:hypothetical protein